MRIVRNVLIGLIALLVVGGVAWAFNGGPLTRKSPLLGGDVPVKKLIETITVTPGELLPDDPQCDGNGFVKYGPNPVVQDPISTALASSTDKDAAFNSLVSKICHEPTTKDAWMQAMFSPSMPKVDGKTLGELNPWGLAALARVEKNGMVAASLSRDASGQLVISDESKGEAKLLVVLLKRLHNAGVVDGWMSTANWHVPVSVYLTVGSNELPRAVLNKDYQEDLAGLRLDAVDKGGTCHLAVEANVLDARPMIVPCDKPAPTPAPTAQTSPTPAPSTTTTSSGGSGSTTTSTTHTTTTNSCPAGTTGTYPNCLQVKTGSNPGLGSGTKESNTVNNNDGSKDSKGVQASPAAAASSAASQASASAAAQASAAASASASASTDSGGGSTPHTSAPPPGPGW